MLFNAKNGTLKLPYGEVDYIRFGTGPRPLVILPGLGDGLRTVKGTALPMALMYRAFARDFTVYMFSRKRPLPPGCTTRQMARHVKDTMAALGIARADVMGVSMGGMIAQWLAADYPALVGRLVLVVSSPCPNPLLKKRISRWAALAQEGRMTLLMDENLRYIYTPAYYKRNKPLIPLAAAVSRPRSFAPFLTQAGACLGHNALAALGRIQAPTFVVGGGRDAVLGPGASRQLAAAIPGARLRLYRRQGHGLYEEAKSFLPAVLAFLLQE